MLSTAAANALLKTLEEPPSHVVFVLATTDPQKVPPTIRSRTQHLEFRLLGAETLHELVEAVNAEAGLELDEEALEAAVRRGRGSARDTLSALDQVVASGTADAARPELSAVLEALADGDAPAVLVAVSALLAGGWGPQQLATELVDDLRQVFLAVLAPELCASSGSALDRFRGLAEAIGLARVVRSMEILGRALVDMREAPDAQVVLEIAVVRAVRPDLDSDVEALSERVSVLERSFSGDAAFPRPGATGRASRPESVSEAPTAPDAPDPSRRPTIGALRRGQQATTASEPSVEPTPAPAPAPAPMTPTPTPEPASAAAPVPSSSGPVVDVAPTPPTQPGAGAGAPVDRDSLTEAWGDGILQSLPARAKARYASGRFVAVDEQGAHFALPNAAHRDQCVEHQGLVEAALAGHFGTQVRLVLGVDADAAPGRPTVREPAASGGGPASAAPLASPAHDDAEDLETLEEVDAAAFMDAAGPDQAAAAEARLLEVFPGASEVTG